MLKYLGWKDIVNICFPEDNHFLLVVQTVCKPTLHGLIRQVIPDLVEWSVVLLKLHSPCKIVHAIPADILRC